MIDVLDSSATVSANSDISAFADGLKATCAEYRVADQDHRTALQAAIGTVEGGVCDVLGSGLRDLFLAEVPLSSRDRAVRVLYIYLPPELEGIGSLGVEVLLSIAPLDSLINAVIIAFHSSFFYSLLRLVCVSLSQT